MKWKHGVNCQNPSEGAFAHLTVMAAAAAALSKSEAEACYGVGKIEMYELWMTYSAHAGSWQSVSYDAQRCG